MYQPQHQPASTGKCVTLLQYNFDGSDPSSGRSYWTTVTKLVTFQRREGSINTSDEFKKMFTLTLTDMMELV